MLTNNDDEWEVISNDDPAVDKITQSLRFHVADIEVKIHKKTRALKCRVAMKNADD
jgi:hypothetical protein